MKNFIIGFLIVSLLIFSTIYFFVFVADTQENVLDYIMKLWSILRMRELNSVELQAMCYAINQAQFNIDRIFMNLSMTCKRFDFKEMEEQLNQIKVLTEQVRNTMYDLRNLQIVEEQVKND